MGRRSALQASTRDTNNQETTTTKATGLPATAITTRATDLRATTTTTTTDHQAATTTTTTTRLTGHLRAATATTKATDHHRPATQLSQATLIRAAAAAATGQEAAALTRGAAATGRQVATDTKAASIKPQFLPSPIQAEGKTSKYKSLQYKQRVEADSRELSNPPTTFHYPHPVSETG